ncbi:MAG TPA: RidA family protein [Methyloceanibacter sp.]|nr:RidA family protein [Methyloceanibacter sp.]
MHKLAGPYHHTVAMSENARWLAISGQVGMDREDKIASGVRAQSEQVFRNIAACLEANGMRKEDLFKVTVYLTDARFLADYRAARSAVMGDDIQPASTLLIVAGFANPDFLVEVEAWAAKSPQ